MASRLFRHILVPHDFSPQATIALRTAAELAKTHAGKLTVRWSLMPRSRCWRSGSLSASGAPSRLR